MGHSHGIYNPTDKPVQWMNINVDATKAYERSISAIPGSAWRSIRSRPS